ncbi:hypothetical protein [Streptomyces sp. NPDC050416]|uniref:hypothetical protein n=1 Tax=Streptomyces sp. NPDC050416 TaxID=3365611 RepID=UPI00379B0960
MEDSARRKRDWATDVSSGAAAIGLMVTGVLGWYQLQEIKEQDREQEQSQAALVTNWVEDRTKNGARPETWVVVISNRSFDPATDVYIRVPGDSTSKDLKYVDKFVGQVPPCSRVEVPYGNGDFIVGIKMTFVDSAGQKWRRSEVGVLSKSPYESNTLGGQPAKYPIKKTVGCGGSS